MVTKEKKMDYELNHIGVLDGVRAMAVLIVVWFHFWQQSWLIPNVGGVSLDWIPRNGYLFVDYMILLSGFCLFLPYARQMVYGGGQNEVSTFYIKRVARIMPVYYISLLVILFAVALREGQYADSTAMWQDLLPHLTFTHNLFPASAASTHLNGVLWTVAVEMQYYLFFPFLAKAFQKKPMVTYWCMTAAGLLASWYISGHYDALNQGMVVNHTLTFAGVYANGMLAAWLYVAMTKDREKNRAESILWTFVAIACVGIYKVLCEHRMSYVADSRWQVDYRYLLSLVFMVFTLAVILAAKWFQKIFDNRVMRFLGGISYNIYICHQYLAVWLKEHHIPFWEGETPPNQLGDKTWMWNYFLLCVGLTLVIATAMTYLIERPIARWIMRWWNGRKHVDETAV